MNKKQITYWLSVAVVGIALGLGLQFVRAWTEPTQAPPGGNVGAPINTSAIAQTKAGGITAGTLTAATVTGSTQLCIGTDCRTTWPSGGTPAPTPGPAPGPQYYQCPDYSGPGYYTLCDTTCYGQRTTTSYCTASWAPSEGCERSGLVPCSPV